MSYKSLNSSNRRVEWRTKKRIPLIGEQLYSKSRRSVIGTQTRGITKGFLCLHKVVRVDASTVIRGRFPQTKWNCVSVNLNKAKSFFVKGYFL